MNSTEALFLFRLYYKEEYEEEGKVQSYKALHQALIVLVW